MSQLLNVKDLYVSYNTDDGKVYALNGLTLSLEKGESLGLVGETGAGKTTLLKTICGILPHKGTCLLEQTVLAPENPPWR